METIAIFGVGLIGGSFALAMRQAGFTGRILGVSSPATVAQAVRMGAIDAEASLEQAAAESDLIYLSQPVARILTTIDALAPLLRPETLVTDAGSSKQLIVARAAAKFQRGQFIGGHPMAGKESRGVSSAEAGLFAGCPYVLTPVLDTTGLTELEGPIVLKFTEWLRKLGTRVVVMSAAEHDRTVAFTSHLPQLLSTALASVIDRQVNENTVTSLAGPGLKDSLRLALSPWEVWGDILATNTPAIDHAVQVYIDKLNEFRENLQTQRLRNEFAIANRAADRFRR